MNQVQIAQLVEIGYVVLVAASCYYALFSKRAPETAHIKEELHQVESTLKELLGEASAASSNLDRTLLKRKGELEKLLAELQEVAARVEVERQAELPKKGLKQSLQSRKNKVEEELPNESWHDEQSPEWTTGEAERYYPPTPAKRPEPRRIPYEQPIVARESAPVRQPKLAAPVVDDRELANVAQNTEDRVSLSSKKARTSAESIGAAFLRAEQANNRTKERNPSPLAKTVEVSTEDEMPRELMRRAIDPVAYRVAKRLLAQGREIHVVARKLELSPADVRLIEEEVRKESGNGGNEENGIEITRETAVV